MREHPETSERVQSREKLHIKSRLDMVRAVCKRGESTGWRTEKTARMTGL